MGDTTDFDEELDDVNEEVSDDEGCPDYDVSDDSVNDD